VPGPVLSSRAEKPEYGAGSERFFERTVQLLMAVFHDPAFRPRVVEMSGYDFSDSGQIICSST